MLFGKVSLSPNQSRLGYDVAITLIATIFAWTISALFDREILWPLLASPALIVAGNWLFGIYNRFRVGSGLVKAVVLTMSVFFASAILWGLTKDAPGVTLWALLVWFPLFLPRVFLNLNTRVKTNPIARSMKNRGPVLLVGGAGYIGSHVVEQLLAANFSVRVLDRFIHDADSLKDFEKNTRLEIVHGDATDIVKLVQAMDGVSAVVHLAGLVGDPACAVDENFTRHTNVITTRMVKEVALSFNVPRFIFASSCSVYGVSDVEVDETSELSPVSLYARTKIDSEKELLLCPNDDFSVTVLRFATVFGHSRRPRFDLVANLFTAQGIVDGKITVTGGDQWRPFVHVSDLARAIVSVLKADPEDMKGKIFNVGDSRLNMTIGQLAEIAKKEVSAVRPVEVVELENLADRRNYAVSFKKIKNELGFESKVLMADGIKEMVKHFEMGTYQNYKEAKYSNVAMTKKAVEGFYDPMQTTRLYRPITDLATPPVNQ